MAKQLYDYWFVQFDFPNEEGKPYKSSGGKMIWSDKLKREIPDSWSVKTLGDLLLEEEKSKIQVGEARDNGGVFPFFTSGEEILLYKDCFANGPHCYLNTGGNADVKFFDGKAAYSTDTWCISFGEFTYYINEFLQLIKPQIDKLFFSGSGLQHLQKESFKQLKLFVPDDKTLTLYNNIVSGCYQQIANIYIENNRLQSLKNNILPLLINGQLNI